MVLRKTFLYLTEVKYRMDYRFNANQVRLEQVFNDNYYFKEYINYAI